MTRSLPARNLNIFIFMIDKNETAINDAKADSNDSVIYYDLQGRRMETPHGLCVEKHTNGFSRIVYMGR